MCSLHVVEEPRAACFNPGHSPLWQLLNTLFLNPHNPPFLTLLLMICCAKRVWVENWNNKTLTAQTTERLSWNDFLVFLVIALLIF